MVHGNSGTIFAISCESNYIIINHYIEVNEFLQTFGPQSGHKWLNPNHYVPLFKGLNLQVPSLSPDDSSPKAHLSPACPRLSDFCLALVLSSTTWLLEQHPFLFDPQFFLLGSHRLPSTPARVWRDLPRSAHQPQSPLALVHEPSHRPCICPPLLLRLTFSGEERREFLFCILLFLHIHTSNPQPVWRAFALHKNLFFLSLGIRFSTSTRIIVDPSVGIIHLPSTSGTHTQLPRARRPGSLWVMHFPPPLSIQSLAQSQSA